MTGSCEAFARVAKLAADDIARERRIDTLRSQWVSGRTTFARQLALYEMRREINARSPEAAALLGKAETPR